MVRLDSTLDRIGTIRVAERVPAGVPERTDFYPGIIELDWKQQRYLILDSGVVHDWLGALSVYLFWSVWIFTG